MSTVEARSRGLVVTSHRCAHSPNGGVRQTGYAWTGDPRRRIRWNRTRAGGPGRGPRSMRDDLPVSGYRSAPSGLF